MVTVCFALFFAMVAACLAAGWSVAWALLGGLILFWLLGLRLGFTWGQLWEMAWAKCRKSLIVVRIIRNTCRPHYSPFLPFLQALFGRPMVTVCPMCIAPASAAPALMGRFPGFVTISSGKIRTGSVSW